MTTRVLCTNGFWHKMIFTGPVRWPNVAGLGGHPHHDYGVTSPKSCTPIAGWFILHGKSHLEMDDDWGYPCFREPEYMKHVGTHSPKPTSIDFDWSQPDHTWFHPLVWCQILDYPHLKETGHHYSGSSPHRRWIWVLVLSRHFILHRWIISSCIWFVLHTHTA